MLGTVHSLQICESHRSPMKKVEEVVLITDVGIEGDIHASSEIRPSPVPDDPVSTYRRKERQVLLMDLETLQKFNFLTKNIYGLYPQNFWHDFIVISIIIYIIDDF